MRYVPLLRLLIIINLFKGVTSTMLQLLRKELESKGALSGELPAIIQRAAEAISITTIPDKMKYTIAASEAVLFASQFRRNINHWDGTLVPINSVGVIITGSGGGKDSSVNAIRRCFQAGYDMINERRKELAKQKAIQEARESGEDSPTVWEVYKKYYNAPNPLFVAPSTPEGFIQHLNDLDTDGIGAGYIYTGELGAELSTSPMFIENIKVLSELYDVGKKEVKVLKNRDNQSKEIKGLPVSALFQSSPTAIIYDEGVKRKFRIEFESKLARRSYFCFTPEEIKEPSYDHIPDSRKILYMIEEAERIEDEALTAVQTISKGIITITEENLSKVGKPLEVDPEVRKLFLIYRRYNNEVASTISNMYSMPILVRRHLQWKALKLSGAIAIFNQHDTITENDYIEAIRFCESLDEDLMKFEIELNKEPYELFSDYIRYISEDSKAFVSLHDLRKRSYISTTGNPANKLKELAHLAASYDLNGIYTSDETGIHYEAIIKSETLNVSFKAIDNSVLFKTIENNASKDEISKAKTNIASSAVNGFEHGETTFADLAELLKGDFAYSPFCFKNGVRGKDNIIGGTKWLVLDIDDSTITAEEAHFMLQDLNHHIALSSNKDNQFKFRVLIELDSSIDTDAITWKNFCQLVSNHLAFKADPVPQSQIFFSYSGRPVYSTLDAEPLEVRDFIMEAIERTKAKPEVSKRLTNPQKQALLSDELTTFIAAFEAKPGGRNRELIKAAYYARDLGMTNEEIIDLMLRINEYWVDSINDDELEKTIISQIRRWR